VLAGLIGGVIVATCHLQRRIPDLAYLGTFAVEPTILYYLGVPHYRSAIDYSDDALRQAAVTYRRIERFIKRAAEMVGPGKPGNVPPAFAAAMHDDLNTSAALAVVHDAIHQGSAATAADDETSVRAALTDVRAMLGVLGLDPLDPAWHGGDDGDDIKAVVGPLVALALEQRARARDRKDWTTADSVRDQLKDAGIQVEDTPAGPRWTLTKHH